MECLNIDWESIDDTFVRDEFYESIQAPKWIDFTAPLQPVDDHDWFCGKVGCTHEKTAFLQAPNAILIKPHPSQESMASLQASNAVAHVVAPLAGKTVSGGGGAADGKRARGVVSRSLSSLSDIKEAFAKHKVLHHPQMPSVAELKEDNAKKSSQQQASENENPNQTCKAQHGVSKVPIFKAPEGIAKKINMSESKDVGGREPRAHVPSREVPARGFKTACSTLSEQVNHPQTGSVLDVSKSTTILGKRDAMHGKSTLSRIAVKEQVSDVCSTSEVKTKKAEGTQAPFSVHPLRPAFKNSHLTSSLVMPIRRSTVVRVFKTACSTLSEQVNHPQTGSVLDVSKSTTILGKRDAMHGKSTLSRIAVKEQVSDVCSTSEVKTKKAEGTQAPFSAHPLRPAFKNSHLTSSLVMPIRRSTVVARSLHGVYLGNEKSAPCRPPRVIARNGLKVGAVPGTANIPPYQKKSGCKEEKAEGTLPLGDLQTLQGGYATVMLTEQELCQPASTKDDEPEHDDDVLAHAAFIQEPQTQTLFKDGKDCRLSYDEAVSVQPMMQEQCPTKENQLLIQPAYSGEEQPPQPLGGVEENGKATHTQQTSEKEDLIQSMLENFLKNLCLTTPEDELSSHSHSSEQKMVQSDHVDCTPEQKMVQSHHVDSAVDNDTSEQKMVQSDHVDCMPEQEMAQFHHVDSAVEERKIVLSHHVDGVLEQEMVQSMRCSSQSASSQISNPLTSQDGSYGMASQVSSSIAVSMHTTLASMDSIKDCEGKDKKQDLQMMKDWQRSRGRKRNSSELNFKVNCSSKDHRHETHKVPANGGLVSSLLGLQSKNFSTTRLPTMAPAPPPHGFLDSCKEQHKKMKTVIVQPFKPFRLRTEERGSLKELGLGRKELGIPNPQESVHHALRMPSFGHPFRPQRSTKKLTIPKEPNFHPSRTRKTLTRHAAMLVS